MLFFETRAFVCTIFSTNLSAFFSLLLLTSFILALLSSPSGCHTNFAVYFFAVNYLEVNSIVIRFNIFIKQASFDCFLNFLLPNVWNLTIQNTTSSFIWWLHFSSFIEFFSYDFFFFFVAILGIFYFFMCIKFYTDSIFTLCLLLFYDSSLLARDAQPFPIYFRESMFDRR